MNEFIDRLSIKRQVSLDNQIDRLNMLTTTNPHLEERRLAPYEELARLVIKHRAALGLSQKELARRVGTSHSAISRIESGRHQTSVATLQRIADALEVRLVLGFESGPAERPTRELVRA